MSTAYVSNAIQIGGLLISMKRIVNGQEAAIGDYNLESLSPTTESVEVNRPDIYGGDTGTGSGWAITEGPTRGSGVIQLATVATPTLALGDYFSASIRVDANGQGVAERWVVTSVGHVIATTDYRKQNVNVRVDHHA